MLDTPASAADIAAAVASGRMTATSVIEGTLARIRERDPLLNSFTAVTEQRALRRAAAIDATRARGETLGPLAGVPFAVKNLFDVAGLTTLAGSKINRDNPPAPRDATLIERLEASGAVLVGALNMGEYAYDFTGENVHDGASRNPHDLNRMSGGSSGGSGASVCGGLVPFALGSDTNGSIRVPASLCGIFGLKPTYGRLSRARTFPFVASFDHVGPLARSARDLALAYDAMQGFDPDDPIAADRPIEPVTPLLDRGTQGLRIAVASGYFKCRSGETCYAVDKVASALGVNRDIDIPQAERARAAAFIITAAEGSSLHVDRLRKRADDYAPGTRDRLIAGALTPAHFVLKAQKFRRWYRDQVLALFNEVDAILTPATPCTSPLLGQRMFKHGDAEIPVAGSLGLYTQPFSFIGLPAVVVPVQLDPLPMGVQIIAAPWREDIVLRLAHALEAKGVVAAKVPNF
jgi:aspartyl-tRNA(Asn)/glutamyl-tRNA(Gln) amidotransferase subunit A